MIDQASGEAQYVSDLGTSYHLYAAVVASSRACATIDHIDPEAALEVSSPDSA